MSNKLLLTFALIGVIVVFSCGLLLPMPIGFKVSMITAGVMMIVMFSIIIPFDRKHIVRKMDIKLILRKQKYIFAGMYLIRFRLAGSVCMYMCASIKYFSFNRRDNSKPVCSIFTNQSQVWIIVASGYLISRISLTLKGIKEIKNHGADWD